MSPLWEISTFESAVKFISLIEEDEVSLPSSSSDSFNNYVHNNNNNNNASNNSNNNNNNASKNSNNNNNNNNTGHSSNHSKFNLKQECFKQMKAMSSVSQLKGLVLRMRDYPTEILNLDFL